MTTSNNKLQSLIYDPNGGSSTDNTKVPSLQVLDQLLLPNETKYITITNIQSTYQVIHNMNIRGRYCNTASSAMSNCHFSDSFFSSHYSSLLTCIYSHFTFLWFL